MYWVSLKTLKSLSMFNIWTQSLKLRDTMVPCWTPKHWEISAEGSGYWVNEFEEMMGIHSQTLLPVKLNSSQNSSYIFLQHFQLFQNPWYILIRKCRLCAEWWKYWKNQFVMYLSMTSSQAFSALIYFHMTQFRALALWCLCFLLIQLSTKKPSPSRKIKFSPKD